MTILLPPLPSVLFCSSSPPPKQSRLYTACEVLIVAELMYAIIHAYDYVAIILVCAQSGIFHFHNW